MNRRPLRSHCPRAQRGVILFIALIVLVAMSLAGIALMRSVDTNVLIAGNLAYRQSATGASDWGIEAARQYLQSTLAATPAGLDLDVPARGYYASWQSALDLYYRTATTSDDFDWTTGAVLVGTDTAGNEVRYVIHRICQNSGSATSPAANCVRSTQQGSSGTTTPGGTMTTVNYSNLQLPAGTQIFYRVTVRVAGPRNTRSFIQAVLK